VLNHRRVPEGVTQPEECYFPYKFFEVLLPPHSLPVTYDAAKSAAAPPAAVTSLFLLAIDISVTRLKLDTHSN
jgi:hypothetical protein